MQPQATQTPPKTDPVQAPAQPASTGKSAPAQPVAPAKGYGKRSRRQWVVIYLVAAIIVYGIIYFAFIRKSGGTSGY